MKIIYRVLHSAPSEKFELITKMGSKNKHKLQSF